jgi:cyclopropane fatty-acyl-phospholipid synthase-like methyltransferase
VLCLGDGIGDLTLALRRAGINATYHDLAGSRTADFAHFRFYMHGFEGPSEMTDGWSPQFSEGYDCVISLDFLEHVTDVPSWAVAVRRALRPGGLFCAQNAFAIGSGANGSIPMHLDRNDRYEKEWDPMLAGLGFSQLAPQWYQVAA